MPTPAINRFQKLVNNIARLYANARRVQVLFAWETGRQIVLMEQDGALRAEYGAGLLIELSKVLSKRYGSGFSETNLRRMRNFYLLHPKQAVPTELDWTFYVELLPLKDERQRKILEQRVIKEKLSSGQLRQLVRKTREMHGEEVKVASSVPILDSKELLTPKCGRIYTYRFVERPQLGTKKDEELLLDLGFGMFKRLSAQTQSRFTHNQIVESEYNPTDKTFGLKSTNRTVKDLFTYQSVVERVIDGDTIKVRVDLGFDLEHRQTLRLRGVDAPEMSTKSGEAAKSFVQSLLKEADTITIFTSRADKYDRYLADVFVQSDSGELFLNNLLLERGHARKMV